MELPQPGAGRHATGAQRSAAEPAAPDTRLPTRRSGPQQQQASQVPTHMAANFARRNTASQSAILNPPTSSAGPDAPAVGVSSAPSAALAPAAASLPRSSSETRPVLSRPSEAASQRRRLPRSLSTNTASEPPSVRQGASNMDPPALHRPGLNTTHASTSRASMRPVLRSTSLSPPQPAQQGATDTTPALQQPNSMDRDSTGHAVHVGLHRRSSPAMPSSATPASVPAHLHVAVPQASQDAGVGGPYTKVPSTSQQRTPPPHASASSQAIAAGSGNSSGSASEQQHAASGISSQSRAAGTATAAVGASGGIGRGPAGGAGAGGVVTGSFGSTVPAGSVIRVSGEPGAAWTSAQDGSGTAGAHGSSPGLLWPASRPAPGATAGAGTGRRGPGGRFNAGQFLMPTDFEVREAQGRARDSSSGSGGSTDGPAGGAGAASGGIGRHSMPFANRAYMADLSMFGGLSRPSAAESTPPGGPQGSNRHEADAGPAPAASAARARTGAHGPSHPYTRATHHVPAPDHHLYNHSSNNTINPAQAYMLAQNRSQSRQWTPTAFLSTAEALRAMAASQQANEPPSPANQSMAGLEDTLSSRAAYNRRNGRALGQPQPDADAVPPARGPGGAQAGQSTTHVPEADQPPAASPSGVTLPGSAAHLALFRAALADRERERAQALASIRASQEALLQQAEDLQLAIALSMSLSDAQDQAQPEPGPAAPAPAPAQPTTAPTSQQPNTSRLLDVLRLQAESTTSSSSRRGAEPHSTQTAGPHQPATYSSMYHSMNPFQEAAASQTQAAAGGVALDDDSRLETADAAAAAHSAGNIAGGQGIGSRRLRPRSSLQQVNPDAPSAAAGAAPSAAARAAHHAADFRGGLTMAELNRQLHMQPGDLRNVGHLLRSMLAGAGPPPGMTEAQLRRTAFEGIEPMWMNTVAVPAWFGLSDGTHEADGAGGAQDGAAPDRSMAGPNRRLPELRPGIHRLDPSLYLGGLDDMPLPRFYRGSRRPGDGFNWGDFASVDHMSYEQLVNLEDVKVPTPSDVLQELPRLIHSSSEATSQGFSGPCSICMEEYTDGETLMRLPCRHVFHDNCASQWLGQFSKLCPVCKASVVV